MPTLAEILKSKIEKGSKSKTYVASKLGITEKTVENYMRGIRQPKPPRLVKLAEILGFDLSELSEPPKPSEQNVQQETLNGSQGQGIGLQSKAQYHSIEGADLIRAIITLTENNKGLIDSNKTICLTNKVIADTNAVLAQKLVGGEPTMNDVQGNPLIAAAMISVVLDTLAEIGAGKRWHSKEEAAAALGNRILMQERDSKKEKDIQSGVGK